MAGFKSNEDHTRSAIKLKIEEAKREWEECVKRFKKKKEDEILDTQEKEFDIEDELK